jgi:hypothetical protein
MAWLQFFEIILDLFIMTEIGLGTVGFAASQPSCTYVELKTPGVLAWFKQPKLHLHTHWTHLNFSDAFLICTDLARSRCKPVTPLLYIVRIFFNAYVIGCVQRVSDGQTVSVLEDDAQAMDSAAAAIAAAEVGFAGAILNDE